MQEAGYGRTRLWASIGWGGMSVLAGAVVEQRGLRVALAMNALVGVACLLPTLLLPVSALQARRRSGEQPREASGGQPARLSEDEAKLGAGQPVAVEAAPHAAACTSNTIGAGWNVLDSGPGARLPSLLGQCSGCRDGAEMPQMVLLRPGPAPRRACCTPPPAQGGPLMVPSQAGRPAGVRRPLAPQPSATALPPRLPPQSPRLPRRPLPQQPLRPRTWMPLA